MISECYLCAWHVAVKCDHCQVRLCERCKAVHDEGLEKQKKNGVSIRKKS